MGEARGELRLGEACRGRLKHPLAPALGQPLVLPRRPPADDPLVRVRARARARARAKVRVRVS